MRIVFISNYFNHHQKPVSDRLYELTDHRYTFISTLLMREDRRKLGYSVPDAPYILNAYENRSACQEAQKLISEADAVIIGSADYSYVSERIREKRLTFKYGERPLRNGIEPIKYLPRLIKWNNQYPRSAPVYLLASSAYAAWDYSRIGLFRNKVYRWAYFTPTVRCDDPDVLFENKEENGMIWVARMLALKHPEHLLETARRLNDNGYSFKLKIIGIGPLEDSMKQMTASFGLEDKVSFLGALSPQQVRDEMDKSQIFLFTSDKQEGWGAVVNEAMNSGCAVVASHAAGAVPFLINDGENGYIYQSENVDMLYEKTRFLLDNPQLREKMGRSAYKTIVETWNAETAGSRLMDLTEALLSGDRNAELFSEGPCSKAEIIKDNWFCPK